MGKGPISVSTKKVTNISPADPIKTIAGWETGGDSGYTFVGSSRAGGGLVLTTDSTDNDEAWATYGGAMFNMVEGRRWEWNFGIKGTEGNTDDANWFVGWSNEFAANMISDSDVLDTDFDAIGIYKLSGSLFFRYCFSNGTTQDLAVPGATAFASATDYKIRMAVQGRKSGIAVQIFINDFITPVKEYNLKTFTSFANCKAGLYIKNGGANAEVVELFGNLPVAA